MQPTLISVGRRYREKEDNLIEDPFLNDYNKIIQSKAYRRLASKTQVMCFPNNPHVRTRLIHTNEVIATSVAIASQLGLNERLCMAIAAGHDIGHTPYGHLGESVLSTPDKPFKHYINSVVVAQHIERQGNGLNLTKETLEGMLNHSRGAGELTVDSDSPQEYSVVMFADKIAYTFSDINDALRYGYLTPPQVPRCAQRLGWNQRAKVETVVKALVEESRKKGFVQFSEGEEFEDFDKLKKFMYAEVYPRIDVSVQNRILERVLDYFKMMPEFSKVDPVLAVSLLTDREVNYFGNLLLESRVPSVAQIQHFGIFEIIDHLKGRDIDYTDPDLDWESFNQESQHSLKK